MRKKLLIVLLSLISTICLAICLSACGLNNSDGTNDDKQYSEQTDNNPNDSDSKSDNSYSNSDEDLTVDEYGFVYTLSDSGTYYTVTAYNGTNGSVVIPSTYNGIPVTEIGKELFYFSTVLKEITIPSSITYIGECAFCNYTYVSIENVYYNGTASQWASITFHDNTSNPLSYANNFYLNGTLAAEIKIEGITVINDYAFYDCSMLTSVTLTEDVTSIGFCSFYGCSSIKSITIPDSVTSIGGQAFNDCSSLESLTLGKNLKTLGYEAFRECSALSAIYFNATAMEDLSSYNSIFIRWQDGAEIIVTIGANVTRIPAYLFSATDNFPLSITSIVFEENSQCKSIEKYAFYYCNFITSIKIPTSVTSIGEYAFSNCSSLEKVNYDGTASQWASISFDNSYSNPLYYANNLYLSETLATSITFDDITTINAYAFYNCCPLVKVTIGSNISSIGSSAFNSCYKLIEVYNLSSLEIAAGSNSNGYVASCAKNVYTISSDSYLINSSDYIFYNDNGTYYLMGYTGTSADITLPDNINGNTFAIYDYAFYHNTSITGINIGNGVTAIGKYAFRYCSELTTAALGNNVKNIGSYAFQKCSALTTVTISDSVTSIGNYAFNGCTSIEKFTVNSGNTHFRSIDGNLYNYDGTVLRYYAVGKTDNSFTVPAGVTTIGSYAFYGCTSLTNIKLPNSVTTISNYAFCDCISLTSINLPESITSIQHNAFYNCSSLVSITIPSKVTSIETQTFYGCTALTNISLGSEVTSIEPSAFKNTAFYNDSSNRENNLLYIDNYLIVADNNISGECSIKDGTTLIASSAFNNCTSLTSVIIPNSVIIIGTQAFYSCTSLTNIDIPDSVTYIGNSAFNLCTSLNNITIGRGVTSIGEYAFENTGYYNNASNWENNVLYIGNYLIVANTSISGDCSIKDGTLLIALYAFNYCKSLSSVTLPDSLTIITEYAFVECTSLADIFIPNSVISIDIDAFCNCTSLSIVYYNGTSADWQEISIGTFMIHNQSLSSATIYYYSETQPSINGNYWHYDENNEIVVWTTE